MRFENSGRGERFDGIGGSRPDGPYAAGHDPDWRSTIWENTRGHNWEWAHAQEEVAAEQTHRLALAAHTESAHCSLLSALRGHPIPPHHHSVRHESVRHEGMFMLVTLTADETDAPVGPVPLHATAGQPDIAADEFTAHEFTADEFTTDDYGDPFGREAAAWQNDVARAECVLYVWYAAAGWTREDTQWFHRLRATGVPVLPVALLDDAPAFTTPPEAMPEPLTKCFDQTGIRASAVCVSGANNPQLVPDQLQLLERIHTLCPHLAIGLAREIPGYRARVVAKEIGTSMLLAGLLGAGPMPLIDLPLLVAIHWKLMLRIAAMYGRPRIDVRSWEMGGALAFGLVLRTLIQQTIKLTPLFGWLLSGLLSALSTWLLGQALVRHYADKPLFFWPEHRLPRWRRPQIDRWRNRMGKPRHTHASSGLKRLWSRLRRMWMRNPYPTNVTIRQLSDARQKGQSCDG